jgi:hypothetical protein
MEDNYIYISIMTEFCEIFIHQCIYCNKNLEILNIFNRNIYLSIKGSKNITDSTERYILIASITTPSTMVNNAVQNLLSWTQGLLLSQVLVPASS